MSRFAALALLAATAIFTIALSPIQLTTLSAIPLPTPLLAPIVAPRIALTPAAPAQEPGFVVHRAPAFYPAEAKQKRIGGSVAVELNFDVRGEIVDSRVLAGPEELRQAALQTALQGKYSINRERSLQVIVDFVLPPAGTSEISGTITDSSRVPIPGATIEAANSEAGAVAKATSDETGAYRFPSLPAGTYRLSATLSGFQSQSYNKVPVGDSQQVRLNFALQPASSEPSK